MQEQLSEMTGHIHIHQGNRLEDLVDSLGRLMVERRRQHFSLEPDIVLINNFEMAQWLSIRIAEKQGICANVQFRLTGSFAWDLAGELMEEDAGPFTRQRLSWVVFRCLQEASSGQLQGEGFAELESYVECQGERGLYHLSRLLSDLFDRYLNYRLDMLNAWEEGRLEERHGWQPRFWRLLSQRTKGRLKAAYFRQLTQKLLSSHEAPGMPRRLYIFGISYLPPLHLDLLSAVSAAAETHMFILNPCRQYWLDTVSQRKRAALKRRLDPKTVDELFPQGNRLLSSFGYAGRSFLARLYSYPLAEGRGHFTGRAGERDESLLAMIQDDILELRQGEDVPKKKRTLAPGDRSVLIHSCCSRLREVECLHDYLVNLFDTEEDLSPHDVIVMAPSIEDYAPLVEAVFSAVPEERYIPFSITDQGLERTDPLARAFLSIFTAPLGDFTAPSVMDILSQPFVMKRYDIDQEGLVILRKWVKKSGIRRGIGSVAGSCSARQNSWIFGLDRLFASMCMDCTGPLETAGVMPVDFPVEGGQSELLSGLSAFFFNLAEISRRFLATPAFSPDGWMEIFMDIMATFLSMEPESDEDLSDLLNRLSGLVDAMKEAGVGEMSFVTMCEVLRDELQRPPAPRAYISGNLLFSSLVPMRSIPFRVICLLGMNDSDFPRRPDTLSFDLMAGDWQPGDKVPREEDRYLFLETLMSARQRLLISYVGRRERDDAPQNPSVVVSELLDYIHDGFRFEDNSSPERHILVEHPLQPFSTRYTTGEPGPNSLFSYAAEWMGVDERGRSKPRSEPADLCPGMLPLSDQEQEGFSVISPGRLALFFSNPARFFLENRLNINVYVGSEALEDQEPFSISREAADVFLNMLLGLDESHLPGLKSQPRDFLERVYRHLRACGLVPVGLLGEILWQRRCQKDFLPFIKKRFLPAGLPGETVSLDAWLPAGEGSVRVAGNIGRLGQGRGLVEYRFQVYDSQKIAFWIKHLLLMLSKQAEGEDISSSIVTLNTQVEIKALSGNKAAEVMEALAGLYMKGLEIPLPFFPPASWDFAKRTRKGLAEQAAQEKAYEKMVSWQDSSRIKDPWIDYLYRGQASMVKRACEGSEFARISNAVCSVFLDHLKRGR